LAISCSEGLAERSRTFWPLIFATLLLEAAAAAALTVAFLNRNFESSQLWDLMLDRTRRGNLDAEVLGSARGLEDPLPWLIAGVIFAILGAGVLIAAARRR
jgi:hypothetical protein